MYILQMGPRSPNSLITYRYLSQVIKEGSQIQPRIAENALPWLISAAEGPKLKLFFC